MDFKSPSTDPLVSEYILRLGLAEQKQQRPSCPIHKMYLKIRGTDEGCFNHQNCSWCFIGHGFVLLMHHTPPYDLVLYVCLFNPSLKDKKSFDFEERVEGVSDSGYTAI